MMHLKIDDDDDDDDDENYDRETNDDHIWLLFSIFPAFWIDLLYWHMDRQSGL